MAATARESLRELCSDYFDGQISTDVYRLRRAALLDNVGLGPTPPADDEEGRTQPRPTVTVRTLPSVANAPQTSAVPHRKLLYAGAAGVVLLLIVLFVTDLSAVLHVLVDFP